MKHCQLRIEAEVDLFEAALWYETEREGLGFEFDAEINAALETPPNNVVEKRENDSTRAKRKTRRELSDRQRFRILVRDGFRCQACGASPLVEHGVELHVDHVVPWSRGGETNDDNLKTRCKQCNLGKGNAFSV